MDYDLLRQIIISGLWKYFQHLSPLYYGEISSDVAELVNDLKEKYEIKERKEAFNFTLNSDELSYFRNQVNDCYAFDLPGYSINHINSITFNGVEFVKKDV